jgi:hypothetical protein
MNFDEIQNTIEHLKKTCKCPQCDSGYENKDINLVATTTIEGLLEMKCPKCHASTLVTVVITPVLEVQEHNHRPHRSISDNELLDLKNFLSNFNGDFKTIFNQSSNQK